VAAAAEPQPETEKAPAEVDPVAARDAKRASQRSLERGDAKASIEAGEQSVALDPSDAEAWLILGAAYQARGAYSEGRRCFSTCARVAKRGPRGECGALAH
jgi:cytochrome c-type biogenesis protein CcmH/NrfG